MICVAVQVFDVAEPEPRKIARERRRIEEQLKRFAGASHSRSQRVERQLLRRAKKRSFHGEVEHDAAAGRQPAMNWMVASKAGRER